MKITKQAILRAAALLAANLAAAGAVSLYYPGPAAETLSRVGSQGNEVKAIQQELKDRGLYSGEVDGIFGSATESAVKRFQTQQGLTADGVAGPQTLAKLGISIGTVP